MTFIPLPLLEERRRQGLSPQGGPLPADKFSQIVGTEPPLKMTAGERKSEIHNILSASWNHPGDVRLWRRICELVGNPYLAPLAIHEAADYVHKTEASPERLLEQNQFYEELMQRAACLGRETR